MQSAITLPQVVCMRCIRIFTICICIAAKITYVVLNITFELPSKFSYHRIAVFMLHMCAGGNRAVSGTEYCTGTL